MKRMRIPATTANMGPGFDCIGMAFDMYNYIDFEPVDAEDYCELTSGGDAGHIDLSKDNLIYLIGKLVEALKAAGAMAEME